MARRKERRNDSHVLPSPIDITGPAGAAAFLLLQSMSSTLFADGMNGEKGDGKQGQRVPKF